MSEEKKFTLEEIDGMLDKEESSFNFRELYTMLILNWQWFLFSLVACLIVAVLYLRYASPVYQVSSKMLIKDDTGRRRSSDMLANMQDFGFISNSAGIENEVEVLQSHILAREAVKSLKIYTTYMFDGFFKDDLIYKDQPVCVDLDPEHLNWLDEEYLTATHSIRLTVKKNDEGYVVNGTLYNNGVDAGDFEQTFKSLPAAVKTDFGTLTFTQNPAANKGAKEAFEEGRALKITMVPPVVMAGSYVGKLTVAPTSKMTSIALLTVQDNNVRRAIDYLDALVASYNGQANADKNEVALKTEEFINGRLEKIDAELGTTEGELESYKKRNRVTELTLDASQTVVQANQYSARLSEASSQIQLIDYLREFVDKPSNRYEIIPSNVGLTDQASVALIAQFNQNVLDRNRLLKSVSEQAPQVQTLTSTLDEIRSSIRTALLQARRAADIMRQGIERQYSMYQSRVSSSPEQERVLTQIGRQQEVKSGLYLLLLQKREENSISLAATADKGKIIENPQFGGKVSPKSAIILLAAIILGLAIPYGILFLIRLFSYRIEGHDDLAKLTTLPIVADVAVANESAKTTGGIVVHENRNDQIDEIFRGLRTNIQFMLTEGQKTILFTSSTSGEGKTFNAANVAMSFALLGKKVILCGLDIRKPALGVLFNLKDTKKGITNLLVKEHLTASDVHEQISKSGINANLDLLLAGPIPPNPAELLARQTMGDVIGQLQKEYDYVILDTAPVGLVTDTLLIAKYANVSCYVTREDYTPKSNVALLNALVSEGKLQNVCVILNAVDMSKKKNGYYYGYGRYGKYGKYGYGKYGKYGHYGKYGYGNYGHYGSTYGTYASSHYGKKEDNSIKK
jgi:capsular exopolysaccharide synthesis family protein